ncbi:MAG: hypothetical protein N4R31_02595 [Lactobacillus crispatus]|nr:hypothetical protein [Lactobacillus crispatus]
MFDEKEFDLLQQVCGLDFKRLKLTEQGLKKQIDLVGDDLKRSANESYLSSDDLENAARRLTDLASEIKQLKLMQDQLVNFESYKKRQLEKQN